MKLLITGASGFVGWNAVRYFADRLFFVQPTFRSFPHYLHYHSLERVQKPVQLDITDRRAVDIVVSRFRPDYILHTAALARPQASVSGNRNQLYETNVRGTEHLVRAAAQHGSHLFFLSTDLVYPADAGSVDEGTPTGPSGAGEYSGTKLQAEELLRTAAETWTIVRCTLMFGNGTPRSNSFSQFLERKWAAGEPAPVFSDQIRSFLYVGDLLSGIETLIHSGRSAGELYVCGGEENLSRADFAGAYARALGVPPELCNVMRSTELEGYVGGPSDIRMNTAKLRGMGWHPRSLTECFREMAANKGKFVGE